MATKILDRDLDLRGGARLLKDGAELIDAEGNITAPIEFTTADAIKDSNGNEELGFGETASAVNYIKITNAATATEPAIEAVGDDTNVGLLLAGKGTGGVGLGQATSLGVVLVATQPLMDQNLNELFKFTATASAINEFTVANAATGNGPSLVSTGGDTNIPATVAGKGTGAVILGQATSTDVRLAADQPIGDSSGNELIKFVKTASAVNEITVTNNATGSSPSISATGGDTNINVVITGKGSGGAYASGVFYREQGAPTAKTVSSTMTAAELATGIITVNQAAGATSAQQLPTATDMDTAFAAMPNGGSFDVSFINTSTVDAEDASVTTNTGWTLVGSMDFHAYSAAGSLDSSGVLRLRKTGTGAWTAYRIS